MKTEEWLKIVGKTFDGVHDITATKGIEYRRDSDDQFENFKRNGAELGISPMAVLHTYLNKHLDAIRYYIKQDKDLTLSEPIEGRIDDAIVYLLLLKGMIIERRLTVVAEPAYKEGDKVAFHGQVLVCTDPTSKLPPPTGKDWLG